MKFLAADLQFHRFGLRVTWIVVGNELIFTCFLSLVLYRLRLHYEVSEGSSSPESCNGHTPAVTITFICPSSRHSVGSAHTNLQFIHSKVSVDTFIQFIYSFIHLQIFGCTSFFNFSFFMLFWYICKNSCLSESVTWLHRAAFLKWQQSLTVVTRWTGWLSMPVTETILRAIPANWRVNSMTCP